MKISRAVKKAVKQNKYITLPEWHGYAKIKPKDGPECCVTYLAEENRISPRWEPQAKDFLNRRWKVVD